MAGLRSGIVYQVYSGPSGRVRQKYDKGTWNYRNSNLMRADTLDAGEDLRDSVRLGGRRSCERIVLDGVRSFFFVKVNS